MENYKILGIDENASMEEVRQAYENKVNEIRREIVNEKRAKAFIEVFDKAYEEIKIEKDNLQNLETTVINIKKFNSEQNTKNNTSTNDFKENKDNLKNNNKKKKSSSTNSLKNSDKKSSKSTNKDKINRGNNNKKRKVKKEDDSSIGTLIKSIFKILAVPVIVILTIVIFLCKVINLISWIATKVIIVGAIAIAAIHGYQVYIGQPMYYEIFIGCAIAFLIALLLPSILKIVPSLLEKINNKLKDFAF